MYIEHVTTADLAAITAGLARQGVTFRATPANEAGTWTIELTGGY